MNGEATSSADGAGGARPTVDPDAVMEALGQVVDPEIGLDIVTLGMVYGVEVDDGVVTVTFTLTTPGCPMEGPITQGVVAVVSALPGVRDVVANRVWDPPWNPGMIRR